MRILPFGLSLAAAVALIGCEIDVNDPDLDVGDIDVGDDDDDGDDAPVNDPDDDDTDGTDGDGADDDDRDDADDGDVADDIEDDDPEPDPDTGPEDVTIYDLQRGDVQPGTRVRIVDAVAVGNHARFGFHAQDPGGGPYSGIWVFDDGQYDVVEGDAVELVGVYREVDGGRQGTLSIVDLSGEESTFEVTGRGPVPNPIPVSAVELAFSSEAEPWEGVLVRVDDVTVLDPEAGTDAFVIDHGLQVDDLYTDFRVEDQDTFDAIVGIVFFSGDRYAIAPRNTSDFQGFEQAGGDCRVADVCANQLEAGDLVVTEVFARPDGEGTCEDETSEWFEVYNTLLQSVSLDDVMVVDENGESSQLVGGVVEPQGYAVVGSWSPDFCYDPPASRFDPEGLMLDDNDTITLRNPETDESIDWISWTRADEGVAIGLDPDVPIGMAENDDAANWCEQSSEIDGSSAFGTPNAPNDECPTDGDDQPGDDDDEQR